MSPTVNLLSPAMRDNPYPVYAELRANAPVTKVDPFGWWAVSRYEDVVYVLKHHELFSSSVNQDRFSRADFENKRLADAAPFGRGRPVMIGSDPPDHTRLRKLVSGAFAPKAITRLEARVKTLVGEYIDRILEKDTFDMMEALAVPLPVTIIAEMLGVDASNRANFKRWSDDTLFTSREPGVKLSVEVEDRIIQSRNEFKAYFRDMIEERRKNPQEDLISDLVRAEVENDRLTSEEVFQLVILLLVAGNETTTNLIGNATYLLLEHPEAERKLREDASLVPAFLEEVLRYESPVRLFIRQTTQEVTLAGVTIPAGEIVIPLFAAANRDPAQFSDPERFDITREPRAHTSFGFGIHFCVGAPLSRLEGRIAFEEIFRRLPPFRRIDHGKPSWGPSFIMHGLKSLPVGLEKPAAK